MGVGGKWYYASQIPWLSKNKPDPSKGFFRDIYNVYEVYCGERSAENLIVTHGKYLKVLLKEWHERKKS